MRITWFGSRCFRIKFSDKELVCYPKEARADFNPVALVGDAIVVETSSHEMFQPLADANTAPTSGRLIDVMDDPERYLSAEGRFVFDAPPDERLVIRDLSVAGNVVVDDWQEGAVVLLVGTFAQCADSLKDKALKNARQLILAVVDPEALDIDFLATVAEKMRIQLAEIGLAIEL